MIYLQKIQINPKMSALFLTKDSNEIITISLSDLTKYPENILNIIWKWNTCQQPCILDNISSIQLQEIKFFLQTGLWNNPYLSTNKDLHYFYLDGIRSNIWDYFLLPFDKYLEDEYSDEEEDDYLDEEEDDFNLIDEEDEEEDDYEY